MTDLEKLIPRDLTPLQRARLKLISHFVIIAVTAALLSGYSYLSSNGAVDWRTLALICAGQAFLAIADAAKKYIGAQGDIPIGQLIDLAEQEIKKNLPSP